MLCLKCDDKVLTPSVGSSRALLLYAAVGGVCLPMNTAWGEGRKVGYREFVSAVVQNHYEKKVSDAAVAEALSAEKRAGYLPDPELSLGRQNQPFASSPAMGVQPPSWSVQISQMFPWPGTLQSESVAADLRSQMSQIENKIVNASRENTARVLYINLVSETQLLELQKANLAEAEKVVHFTDARLALGIGSHHDLLRAQTERDSLVADELAAEVKLADDLAEAALLMGGSSSEALRVVSEFPNELVSLKEGAESKDKTDFEAERITSLRANKTNEFALLEKRSSPNFMTSLMLMRTDTGMTMGGAMLGVRVPLFSGAIRDSLAEETHLELRRIDDLRDVHEKRRALTLSRIQRRQQIVIAQLKLLESKLLPWTEDHYKQNVVEYGQGKESYVAVSSAQRLVLLYKSAKVRLEADLAKARLANEAVLQGLRDDIKFSPLPPLAGGVSGTGEMGGGM